MKAPVVATISGAWHCGGVRFTARLTDGRERWLAGTRIGANLHATPDSAPCRYIGPFLGAPIDGKHV